MIESQDISWFKDNIEPLLKGYKFEYRFFEEGDFGSLYQVIFDSEKIGGSVDFWAIGMLGIFIWDYKKEIDLFNVLLRPEQENEKKMAFETLRSLLS